MVRGVTDNDSHMVGGQNLRRAIVSINHLEIES